VRGRVEVQKIGGRRENRHMTGCRRKTKDGVMIQLDLRVLVDGARPERE